MAEDLWRRELDGYVRRHEADAEAHAKVQRLFRDELAELLRPMNERITAAERFQERIMGALILLGVVVSSGIVATAVELSRK